MILPAVCLWVHDPRNGQQVVRSNRFATGDAAGLIGHVENPPPATFPNERAPEQGPVLFCSTREAPIGIEPMMEVLQTSALPLGYGAEGQQT